MPPATTAAELVKARRAIRSAAFALALAVVSGAAMAEPKTAATEPKDPGEWALRGETGGAPTAAAATPVASAARVVQFGDVTRLAFDLTGAVDVRAFVLANPSRAIIDLPETMFAIEPPAEPETRVRPGRKTRGKAASKPTSQGTGLVASYRFGRLGPGRSRIVIDLAQPARIIRAEVEPTAEGFQLSIDLGRTDRAAFAAAAASSSARGANVAATSPDAEAPSKRAGDSRPVVVLDPGHGGVDVGAAGPGKTVEKDIVFDFTKTLARQLEAGGRYSVILTRTDDVFVPLSERVRIARRANAQLFVSIHADTLNEGGVSGATVYTVSDRASDAHAAKLAEKENFADKAAGYEAAEDKSEISDILFDLTRRETRAYSHVFARTLVSIWKDAARLNKNPHRSAGFLVLKAPDVPSVLLELGYLSSERDAALLMAPEWREKTAAAVARSIDQFFGMRSLPRPADAAEVSPQANGVAAALHN